MSATNHTPNLNLPQFVEDDKPSWLGDFNGAMDKIDRTFTTDQSAFATANATILALQAANATLTANLAALTARVVVLETA